MIALGVLALVSGRPSAATAQSRGVFVADSFLGVRLDKDRFSDVMKRYGAPHEIQAGGPRLTDSMLAAGTNPAGGGSEGNSGAPGGPGRGLPGFPGGPQGGPPGSPGGFGSGSGSRGSGNSDDEKILYTDQTETTWWYHFARKGKPSYHYAFTFNKEGRVIQIQEYGFYDGGKTQAGIGLGAPLGAVIRAYGFSTDGERGDNDKLTLRYGGTNRLAFQMVSNKVLGITLARVR